ncbi:MAG: bifunctional acetate--CoA ligase family protein/GNAT family N-acetyltransferase [Chlamydiae bacterium]|nr:bifunctional acetate--CoA ligase family protein/GNAT family N-acetyltransferase [Chlamydiota bacterium]
MHVYKDPSQNFLEDYDNPLKNFFYPKSLAIIGATEKNPSVARTILHNLLHQGYKGEVYPVNPKYEKVLGIPCYPSVESIVKPLDLVVIVTPAKTVPALVKACIVKKVPALVIISAGFKEAGEEGKKLEEEVLSLLKNSGTRLIGPNCLGLMNPHIGLNATFAKDIALPGHLAFISQSGAMCTSVLDWSLKEKIGFSAFISIGSMADIQFGDLIEYLGSDPKTEVILIYMETVGDARRFLSSAKKVVLTKPILLIKGGRTQASKQAAASHTGSLAGSDDIFDIAIRRVGILRVEHISDLFDMASALAKQPIPQGPRLAIITNAGGPSVLATDAAILSSAEMASLQPATLEKLNAFLPAAWSRANPVDVLGDASASTYGKALEVVAQDPQVEGILVVLTPQDMTQPLETAQALVQAKKIKQPLLASWMGGESLEEGIQTLSLGGIPHFPYPDQAAFVFGQMWQHQRDLQALYETPLLREEDFDPLVVEKRKAFVEAILDGALQEGRETLTEFESKAVLEAYGFPIVKTIVAATKQEAVQAAESLGFPLVVKLHSETITHKSDVGGVKLNIRTLQEVEKAYEAIEQSVTRLHSAKDFAGVTVQPMVTLKGYEILIGSTTDEQFGPIVVFGTGGQLVEVVKDRSLALPPLNAGLAQKLMQETKIYAALKGVRGQKGVSFEELEKVLILFSKLIIEHPRIKESDINPLLVAPEGMIALDARFILHPKKAFVTPSALRPYPTEYIQEVKLKDGSLIRIRPIRPEDEPCLRNFHKNLSESSVRKHYFGFLSLEERIAHERLLQICCIDYQKEMRFVAETDVKTIVGVCVYHKLPNSQEAEFKLIIVDDVQGKGLGKALLLHLIQVAEKENIQALIGYVLKENTVLLEMSRKLGFSLQPTKKDPNLIKVKKDYNVVT